MVSRRRHTEQPGWRAGVRGGCLVLLAALWGALAPAADGPHRITFDGGLQAPGEPLITAENVTCVPAGAGQAARIGPTSVLACRAPAFLTTGFDIRLKVSHDRPLRDLHFEELVYLYHESAREQSRICLTKRAGCDYLLFSMSDSTGRAKGTAFAGNWFAMKSKPLDWEANSWHGLRITASRAGKQASLTIDGVCVATASGTKMPQVLGERLWLGNLAGRCQMLGLLDEVQIAAVQEGQ